MEARQTVRCIAIGDKGRREEHFLAVEIRLNARTLVNYFKDNFIPGSGIQLEDDVVYTNFVDYLSQLIFREFYSNTNRILGATEPYGGLEDLEIFLDDSDNFQIRRVIVKNNLWKRYLESRGFTFE